MVSVFRSPRIPFIIGTFEVSLITPLDYLKQPQPDRSTGALLRLTRKHRHYHGKRPVQLCSDGTHGHEHDDHRRQYYSLKRANVARNVIAHRIGNAIGLGHNSNSHMLIPRRLENRWVRFYLKVGRSNLQTGHVPKSYRHDQGWWTIALLALLQALRSGGHI